MDFGLSESSRNGMTPRCNSPARNWSIRIRSAREQRGEFWREGYERCGRYGVLGLPVPTGTAARAHDIPTAVAAMEGARLRLPRHRSDLCPQRLALDDHDADSHLRHRGAESTVTLPRLCDGRSFGANGASEPEAGSDIFSMTTRAERHGRRLGFKRPQGLDHRWTDRRRLPMLRHDRPTKGVLGHHGVPDRPRHARVSRRPRDSQAGHAHRADGRAGLRRLRAACRKPAGPRGHGVRGSSTPHSSGARGHPGQRRRHHAPPARPLHPAGPHPQAVRPADRQVPVGLQPDRRHDDPAGDQPVDDLPLRLAQAEGKDATIAASMAKLHVSECFVQNSLDAVRIFGASGYTVEAGLERDVRDSVGASLLRHQRHPAQHHRPASADLNRPQSPVDIST